VTRFPIKRGEFSLLRKIGEGGMAEVFLAERGGDEGFKTLVALKRLHSGFALDQYFIRQLVQEAKLLGQLQHNNIVRVHDFRRIEDEYFIVMEYIDGIDLAQAIHVHREHDLRFPLSIFFHLALCLCESLDYAHTATDLTGKPMRLVHRDMKPSNVLISHRGIVKLTDFGIARVGDATTTGSIVKGTANYMSPEQAAGDQDLGPASDIFSLGAVFWEILTLGKLVEGSNYLNVIDAIKDLNVGLKDITEKGIEPGLRMILLRMLARKKELRYQDMGLVLKDLRFVAEQMKVDLSPSHLRNYMARITNLAREAAQRIAEENANNDPLGPITPVTPVPPIEELQVEPITDEHDIADTVRELEPEEETTARSISPPSGPPTTPRTPARPPASASPPSASGLRASKEVAAASAPVDLVRRNTGGPPPQAVAAPMPPPPNVAPPPMAAPSAPPPPLQAPPVSAPPPATNDTYYPDEDEDDWEDDEQDLYSRRRRTNQMIIAGGAVAAILAIGLFALMWILSNADKTPPEAPIVEAPPVQEDPLDAGTAGMPEGIGIEDSAEAQGDGSAAEERDTTGDGSESSNRSGSWDTTAPAPRRTEPAASDWRDQGQAAGSDRRGSAGGASVGRSNSSEDSWGGPAESPEPSRIDRRSEERARPQPDSDAGWGRSSDSDTMDWSSDSDTVDWSSDSGADEGADDWAVADPSAGDESDMPYETSSAETEGRIDGLTGRAVNGRLSSNEVQDLRVISANSASYNASRAVLLAHFEANQDFRSHCELAEEAIVQPANLADPQFNLEMGKCHLREGRYNEALETARIAEMHAQDIPSRIRTDRQLKIWEVQAKAYKGMYQVTDNLDYVADSIVVWERYRHMATNTYREREIDRAEREIRNLESLKRGAL